MNKLKCDLCKQLKDENTVLILQCGFFICLTHVSDQVLTCPVCQTHSLQKCFQIPKNKLTLAMNDFDSKIGVLNSKIEIYEMIKKDPDYFINEKFSSLTNKIDIRREEVKLSVLNQIDDYHDRLLSETTRYKQNYLNNINLNLEFNEIPKIQDGLTYNDKLSHLEQSLTRLDEIISKLTSVTRIVESPNEFDLVYGKSQVDLESVFGVVKFNPDEKMTSLDSFKCNKIINAHSDTIWSVKELRPSVIITCSDDKTIKIWNTITGENILSINESGLILTFTVLDRGEIVSGSVNGCISVWNSNTGDLVKTFQKQHCSIRTIERLRTGEIIVGFFEGRIKIFNRNEYLPINELNGHMWCVNCIKESSPRRILSGSIDRTIKFWDLGSSNECQKTFYGHSESVVCLEVLTENEFISGSFDSIIRMWSIDSGICTRSFDGHQGPIRGLQAIGNNEFLSCSEDGNLIQWSTKLSHYKKCLRVDESKIMSFKFMTSGELVTALSSNYIKVWNKNI